MKPLALITLLACLAFGAQAHAGAIGYVEVQVPDGANPALEVDIWYPTAAQAQPTHVGLFVQDLAPGAPAAGSNLPLVVISHGNGGDAAGHSDTAYALAEAGFVVAAPTHTGDNYRDQSRATDLAGRTRQLHAVIDYMTSTWSGHAVDPARVGAFGFSAGGFTVLAAAGGDPDLGRVAPHCAAHPQFYDCRLIAAHKPPPVTALVSALVHDGRIRALVVAAPALGFTFTPAGLKSVVVPVQLWRAADDRILPQPEYAEAVRAALPKPPEMHVVEHAGHFDFLAPCSPARARIAPPICVSEPSFDRAAFHRSFNAEVVRFFQQALATTEAKASSAGS